MAKLIPQTILETADSRPEREAACFLDERISYGQLATQVGKLASVLADQGVRSGDRVGIFMDKSLLLPTTMHGIMHAGGAYVPLDPAAPPDRLASILRDCDIRVLVTATNKARTLRSLMKRQTPLERLIGAGDDLALPNISWDDVGTAPCDLSPHPGTGENDLAYIIYTSGSTGVPKGIMHTHYSGLSFASWAAREYGLHYTDRLSNHAPLHFDLSIFDYFAGAVAGATTVIVPEEYVKLAASYSTYLSEQSVSVLFTVPFALVQLLQRGLLEQRDLSALRWVIFGGEPFPTKHLRDLMAVLPHARFDNMYGPAEVNGCTHFTVPRNLTSEDPVPIGRIADIAEQLVVDNQGAVVAAGEIGELLVRTPTMMKGYWGRPDLNETSFYQRHAENRNPDVFYRTGDLVRQESDGILHFIGRKDRQIKVRGYRVELDEIEAALTATNGVADSAVFAVPDGAGSQSIHAAFLPQADVVLTAEEILARLKKLLPRYAVPTTVLCREEFPRTSTGKIDRLRLREQALEAEQP